MSKWYAHELQILVEEVLKYEYEYHCQVHGMDSTYMHPEEIMNNIKGLMRMKPEDAHNSIKASTDKIFYDKLKKEGAVLDN